MSIKTSPPDVRARCARAPLQKSATGVGPSTPQGPSAAETTDCADALPHATASMRDDVASQYAVVRRRSASSNSVLLIHGKLAIAHTASVTGMCNLQALTDPRVVVDGKLVTVLRWTMRRTLVCPGRCAEQQQEPHALKISHLR